MFHRRAIFILSLFGVFLIAGMPAVQAQQVDDLEGFNSFSILGSFERALTENPDLLQTFQSSPNLSAQVLRNTALQQKLLSDIQAANGETEVALEILERRLESLQAPQSGSRSSDESRLTGGLIRTDGNTGRIATGSSNNDNGRDSNSGSSSSSGGLNLGRNGGLIPRANNLVGSNLGGNSLGGSTGGTIGNNISNRTNNGNPNNNASQSLSSSNSLANSNSLGANSIAPTRTQPSNNGGVNFSGSTIDIGGGVLNLGSGGLVIGNVGDGSGTVGSLDGIEAPAAPTQDATDSGLSDSGSEDEFSEQAEQDIDEIIDRDDETTEQSEQDIDEVIDSDDDNNQVAQDDINDFLDDEGDSGGESRDNDTGDDETTEQAEQDIEDALDGEPTSGPDNWLAFITSETYTGDLGGVEGADENCNVLASEYGLQDAGDNNFMAWLSDSDVESSPINRFPNVGTSQPFVRTDDVRIAEDWEELTSANLRSAIALNENEQPQSGKSWTSTVADGNFAGPFPQSVNCIDWTDDTADITGMRGDTGNTDQSWSFTGQSTCDEELHLYCFQVQKSEEPQFTNPVCDEDLGNACTTSRSLNRVASLTSAHNTCTDTRDRCVGFLRNSCGGSLVSPLGSSSCSTTSDTHRASCFADCAEAGTIACDGSCQSSGTTLPAADVPAAPPVPTPEPQQENPTPIPVEAAEAETDTPNCSPSMGNFCDNGRRFSMSLSSSVGCGDAINRVKNRIEQRCDSTARRRAPGDFRAGRLSFTSCQRKSGSPKFNADGTFDQCWAECTATCDIPGEIQCDGTCGPQTN